MVFTVKQYDKKSDTFNVGDDTGSEMWVPGVKIILVALQGYKFTNVIFNRTGFSVVNDNVKTPYTIKMSKSTSIKLQAYIAEQRQVANQIKREQEVTKAAENLAKQQSQARAQEPKPKYSNYSKTISIDGNNRHKHIFYAGKMYYGVQDICKKFNADPLEFSIRYNQGYSIPECLGLKPLRPISEIQPRKRLDSILDSMAMNRGER